MSSPIPDQPATGGPKGDASEAVQPQPRQVAGLQSSAGAPEWLPSDRKMNVVADMVCGAWRFDNTFCPDVAFFFCCRWVPVRHSFLGKGEHPCPWSCVGVPCPPSGPEAVPKPVPEVSAGPFFLRDGYSSTPPVSGGSHLPDAPWCPAPPGVGRQTLHVL